MAMPMAEMPMISASMIIVMFFLLISLLLQESVAVNHKDTRGGRNSHSAPGAVPTRVAPARKRLPAGAARASSLVKLSLSATITYKDNRGLPNSQRMLPGERTPKIVPKAKRDADNGRRAQREHIARALNQPSCT